MRKDEKYAVIRAFAKETKVKLRKRYKKLNPKKLLLEIIRLGKKLSEG